jgi:predicted GNAT family acetyltransferase
MIENELINRYGEYLDGLDIYENKGSLILSRIVIKPSFRNRGLGSKILDELIRYADANTKIIALTPSSDFGGNRNRLIQFYKKFGFKFNKGYYKNFEFRDEMIRYPKLTETKKLIKTLLKENLIKENIVTPSSVSNTRNFWHGGNLDEYSDVIAQKNGRYEFGAGLYLTTQYDVAKKYAKGSRKLYIVTVKNGIDINDVDINTEDAISFIKNYCLTNKRKELLYYIEKYNRDGKVPAYLFNNMILNNKAVKPSNTKILRSFLIKNGIDYELVNNAFGFGEDMMVLYNMDKIVKTTVFGPKDRMDNYNFETK